MPKTSATTPDFVSVEKKLHQLGFKHLRARKRGATILVESGPEKEPVKHLRLRQETAREWAVDMADHRGRWEPTPFSGTVTGILAIVAKSFPWVLQPINENPERLSDPED